MAGREVKEMLRQLELSFIPFHCRFVSFQGFVHRKKCCSRAALVAKPLTTRAALQQWEMRKEGH